jgi:hypothetical protein
MIQIVTHTVLLLIPLKMCLLFVKGNKTLSLTMHPNYMKPTTTTTQRKNIFFGTMLPSRKCIYIRMIKK